MNYPLIALILLVAVPVLLGVVLALQGAPSAATAAEQKTAVPGERDGSKTSRA